MDHPWDTSDNKKLMEIVDNYIDINKTINYFEISKIVNKPEKFIIEIVKYNVYLLISDTNPIESICTRYHLDLDEVINCYIDNTKTTHYFTIDKDNIITLPTNIIEHYSKDKFCFCAAR